MIFASRNDSRTTRGGQKGRWDGEDHRRPSGPPRSLSLSPPGPAFSRPDGRLRPDPVAAPRNDAASDSKFEIAGRGRSRRSPTYVGIISLLVEIPQIRRPLIFFGGHQEAVDAQDIHFLADADQIRSFDTTGLPPLWTRICAVHVPLVHGPGTRQCMVDHGDYVVDDFGIGLIEVDALLENRLIVEVKGKAAGVVDAWPLEAARLGFEHVIGAVAVLVDPPSDRIARIAWLDLLGPVAAVGENATRLGADQNIGGVRGDDEFQGSECHHMRHAGVHAAGAVKIVALTAGGLVRNAVLENLLIFRCERGLLSASPWLGLIERRLPPRRAETGRGNHRDRGDIPLPRALPLGVFPTVGRLD